MIYKLLARFKEESGFMGRTHAAFSVGLYFILLIYFRDMIMFKNISLIQWLSVVICGLIIVVGASLIPDLDNTNSKALNELNFVGSYLSLAMRKIADGFYMGTRTKYDTFSTHRTLWHSLLGLAIWTGGTWGLISIPYYIPSIMGLTSGIKVGDIFLILFVIMYIEVGLSYIIHKKSSKSKKIIKRTRKNIKYFLLDKIGIIIACLATHWTIQIMPDYWFVSCIFCGYLFHLLGDAMTIAGVPFLAPIIKIKGKRWYYFRVAKIHAGSDFENCYILPFFIVLAVCSIGYYFYTIFMVK